MLTTHLASWLVSRALKGRTLTATFTEAPAIAPDTPALLSWRTEKEMLIRATERTPTSLPSFSLQPSFYSPSPTNQSLKDPVPAPSGLPPKYHYFGGLQTYSCLCPQPSPSVEGPGPSPQSYLVSWPQIRGAVSVLAATDPRRGSPILHLGPGHTSKDRKGNPGCGGRLVRRHLWLQSLSGILHLESKR